MSDQPRQAPTPSQPTARPAGRSGVPIARGADRALLERVVDALEHAGVQYAIEDEVAGEAAGSWQVLVPIAQAPRALAALAALRSGGPAADPHRAYAPPGPGPLFESQSSDTLRLLLMLACFAAAAWIATR
jgi:hypothetical protein